MSNYRNKGIRCERELVRLLNDEGFGVTRVPNSGGGTQRELPDVLAGDSNDFYAIEAKSSASDSIYLDNEEVYSLVYFARKFGAKARIGARFDNESWYFFHPDDLHQTDGGNYRVNRETAVSTGNVIEDLLNPQPMPFGRLV